jgi:hypothetical protein
VSRWKAISWWLSGLLLGILILGAFAARALSTRRDVGRWEEYRRGKEATGDDYGVDAWLPTAVADADNFAAHPWIASLMASESSPEAKVAWDWTDWWLEEFEDYMGPEDGKSWFGGKPDEAKRIMARAATLEADFNSIHEASGRSGCRLPVVMDRDSDRLSRASGNLGDATRMLSLHAEAALAMNEESAAVEDLLALLRIGAHLQSQRFLLAVLSGKQASASALSIIEVGLAGGRFSPESQKRLADALRIPTGGDELAATMRLERGLVLEKMGRLLGQKQDGERFLEGFMQPPPRRSARFKLSFCKTLDPMLENATRETWEVYDDAIDEASRKSPPEDLAIGSLTIYGGIFPVFFEHADRIERIRQRLTE